jgi:hypothetical protein
VYVFEVKHLNSKTMSAYEKSAKETRTKAESDGKIPGKLLRLFALYENLIRFVMPLCTALKDRDYPDTPITQSNNIVDISGVGLKQFWNLRTHMQDASTLATAHYPETLDRIFVCSCHTPPAAVKKVAADRKQIIGAPVFFPTVWGWIKKWFDPITTSKIFILSSSEVKKTLASFIDPANIPKKYGGELDFEFGDMPVPDPAWEGAIEWEGDFKGFPGGPLYWIHGDDDQMHALAVGSTHEIERKETVCVVAKPLPAEDQVTNGHAMAGKESEDTAIQNGNVVTAGTEGLDGLSLTEKLASFPSGAVPVLTKDNDQLDVPVDSGANAARQEVKV